MRKYVQVDSLKVVEGLDRLNRRSAILPSRDDVAR